MNRLRSTQVRGGRAERVEVALDARVPQRDRRRAGTFVVMSGIVYFMFMAAWAMLFELVGLSRIVTKILGGALLGMGLINLKDVLWLLVVVVFIGLERRLTMTAPLARTLKGVSGVLLATFGALFLFAPQLLSGP